MTYVTRMVVVILMAIIPISSSSFADDGITADFEIVLADLTSSKFKKRTQAVEKLVKINDKRLPLVIDALLHSQLHYRKADKLVAVLTEKTGKDYASAVLTGESLGVANSSEWKKVIISNRVRTTLRDALAMIQLNDENATIRKTAVDQVLSQIDVKQLAALEKRFKIEQDDDVKEKLNVAISTLKLKKNEGDTRNLIANVKDSVNPSVRQVLAEVIDNVNDKETKNLATKTLAKIDQRVSQYAKVETLFFGLSLGSVLVLAAIGLAITFGVMGVINMAHGELIMLGAYTTYVVQLWFPNLIEYSVLIAIPLAFIVSGLVGILIERGIIRFLYGRPLETLLATFGVSLVLQQVVRSIFGPLNRAVESPTWMSGVWQVNDALALTWNRLYIIVFAVLVFFILLFILKKTTLGLKVRAVSQNRTMACAMGVKANWVDAMTFGLGSGIAGVAGVALSQLTNVGPNLGQAYIIDSFMVVVFGGVGNLWGTLVAGLSLGITNKLLEPWAGAVLAKIIVLLFIILFIQKRPSGLFPQKGRAAT